MTTSTLTDRLDSAETFGQNAFDRLLEKRIDPLWLTAKRKEAWEIFQGLDWPNPRDENWMRSDIRGLKLSKFAPNIEEAPRLQLDPLFACSMGSMFRQAAEASTAWLFQSRSMRGSLLGVWLSDLYPGALETIRHWSKSTCTV